MRNTHTRLIAAPAHLAEAALATLGTDHDRVWPSPEWWPMRFDGPVAPGARGGHGPVRYSVEDAGPRRIRFRFDPRGGIDGFHEFTITPEGDHSLLTHHMEGRLKGPMKLMWPLAVRPCHDTVVEQCFDNIERETTGSVARPYRVGRWTRMWQRLFSDRPRRLRALPESARLGRAAFDGPDYWDSFAMPLRPGMDRDPQKWASAIFFHKPFPTCAAAEGEVLIGDTTPVDFRVSVVVEDRRLVMSTVVRLRKPMERLYFRGVLFFHRAFVKFMLRRAFHRAGVAGRGTLVG